MKVRPPALDSRPSPPMGVVILGAGASSRMGRPKLLLPWGDTTVIRHIIGQWRELGARQIAVVVRPNDDQLIAELRREIEQQGRRLRAGKLTDHSSTRRQDARAPKRISTGYIVNPHPERGMFSSIQCAANWVGWGRGIAAWGIVLGDQPHLRLGTLRRLLAFWHEHPQAICQPAYGGHGRHPVLLPRRAFSELKLSTENTLKEFLKQSRCQSVKCSIGDPALSLDMDTPADYILLHDSLNP